MSKYTLLTCVREHIGNARIITPSDHSALQGGIVDVFCQQISWPEDIMLGPSPDTVASQPVDEDDVYSSIGCRRVGQWQRAYLAIRLGLGFARRSLRKQFSKKGHINRGDRCSLFHLRSFMPVAMSGTGHRTILRKKGLYLVVSLIAAHLHIQPQGRLTYCAILGLVLGAASCLDVRTGGARALSSRTNRLAMDQMWLMGDVKLSLGRRQVFHTVSVLEI